MKNSEMKNTIKSFEVNRRKTKKEEFNIINPLRKLFYWNILRVSENFFGFRVLFFFLNKSTAKEFYNFEKYSLFMSCL